MYFDIAQTGDVSKLQIEGSASDTEQVEAWEEIIKKNAEANGDHSYKVHLENSKQYALLVSEYLLVKGMLYKVCLEVDEVLIQELNTKGYRINNKAGQNKFEESISSAFKRCENLVTKARMKLNELKAVQTEKKPVEFESVMAGLIDNLGYEVSDNITLARFNEFQKRIKAKHKVKHGRTKS